jgi:hypothetical protein
MNVVSFGGGSNSTAMLIGMHERGIACDLILFADTGSEKPYTYAHITEMNAWLAARNFPQIKTIRGLQPQMVKDGSLEVECVRLGNLPAVAYGRKACSLKWKVEPQARHMKKLGITEYTKFIGFDADEPHRAKGFVEERYPLIEWDWGRDECIAAIDRAGIRQPGKSACFFCPNSKKHEIIELGRLYPDLLTRALAIEAGATLDVVKGLGRRFAWADVVAADEAQLKLIPETSVDIACGCYDGESKRAA